MEKITIIFAIGNLFFLLGSYPMIKAAIANRKSLQGFSFTGASLTTLGMITMMIGYIYLNTYITAIIAIPTLLYWCIVTWYNRGSLCPK